MTTTAFDSPVNISRSSVSHPDTKFVLTASAYRRTRNSRQPVIHSTSHHIISQLLDASPNSRTPFSACSVCANCEANWMWLLWCAELVNVLHEQPCGRPVDRLTILDSYEIQNGGHITVPTEKNVVDQVTMVNPAYWSSSCRCCFDLELCVVLVAVRKRNENWIWASAMRIGMRPPSQFHMGNWYWK